MEAGRELTALQEQGYCARNSYCGFTETRGVLRCSDYTRSYGCEELSYQIPKLHTQSAKDDSGMAAAVLLQKAGSVPTLLLLG